MNVRKGDWIQTFCGVQFWPLDPREGDILIADIAHSLANQCRFSGHCNEFYSVAEHSVRVSNIVAPEHALWGLMHDAAEAYLVDLPRPLKRHTDLGDLYRQVESGLMACVCRRFGLPVEEPVEIKHADNVLLMTEKRDLMGPEPHGWSGAKVEPLTERIVPWHPKVARKLFLERFALLTGEPERALSLKRTGGAA